jgi:putative peptide zinc metalloprotease protein
MSPATSPVTAAPPAAPIAEPPREPPRLAPGVELIGEYRDSGFAEPQYLARRGDGQVLQLSRLVYLVAAEIDGRRGLHEIADRVGPAIGRRVSAANVAFLVDERLTPVGLIAAPGADVAHERASPLLGLRFRTALIRPRGTRTVARALSPLFLPPVVLAVLGALAVLDVWLFAFHGVGAALGQLIAEPALMLALGGLLLVSTVFHECGHAAACRYGGATPGAMGVGIYLVWPACYTDVTDSYRLGRAGRLRTDLGGVYFNAIFILATAGAYLATGYEPLLALILFEHLGMLEQFLPWVRLDGYYVVSDLAGVPDAFAHVRPMLRSALPGRRRRPAPTALTPRARRALLAYIATFVPVLLLVLTQLALAAPGLVAAAWDSFRVHLDAAARALDGGHWASAAAEALQVAILGAPVVGAVLTTGLIVHRVASHVRGRRPVGAAGARAA